MNEEKILIKATFKKNFLPYILFALALIAIILLYTGDHISFLLERDPISRWNDTKVVYEMDGITYEKFMEQEWRTWNRWNTSIMNDYTLIYTWISFGVLVLIGIVLLLCWRCELTVTDKRIYGKVGFGKRVDLPLHQVSAIGMGAFSNISVATSSGSLHFWLVENKNEVYEAISNLLNQMQTPTASTAVAPVPAVAEAVVDTESNNIEKLKKYKDLLDNGIITQEEFEAKKKQLLDL